MTKHDLFEWGIVLSIWTVCIALGWAGVVLIILLCGFGLAISRVKGDKYVHR